MAALTPSELSTHPEGGDPTVRGGSLLSFVPTPLADPGPLGLAGFAMTTFVL